MLYRISVLKNSVLRIVLLLSFCLSETLEGAKKLTLAYKSFVLQVCNFIKKRLWYKCFHVPSTKSFRKVFLNRTTGATVMIILQSFLGTVMLNHWRCSIKRAVFKNFAIFTGKHLCQSLSLIKLLALRQAILLKKNTPTQVFLS